MWPAAAEFPAGFWPRCCCPKPEQQQTWRELGVSLCGGHTEITHGLGRPIVVGHMLGEAPRDGYVAASGARIGDRVILTKQIAIEGTALMVREKRKELVGVLPADELACCARFLRIPGISVVKEARAALEVGGVHALHDPTEGGLATGLGELAQAADVGLLIDEAAIPLLPECVQLCRHFGLDPLGLIASGSLLIAAAPDRVEAIVTRLRMRDYRRHKSARSSPLKPVASCGHPTEPCDHSPDLLAMKSRGCSNSRNP
jgi:hydrogenase maturation factor